jgi:hypothetical protein
MPVLMPVLMRVPVRVLMGMRVLTLVPVMCMIVLVMLFMFHQVRIPSMLECLHAPQRREKNARP